MFILDNFFMTVRTDSYLIIFKFVFTVRFTGCWYISGILLTHCTGFHCEQTQLEGRTSERSSSENGQLSKSTVCNLMLVFVFAEHEDKNGLRRGLCLGKSMSNTVK